MPFIFKTIRKTLLMNKLTKIMTKVTPTSYRFKNSRSLFEHTYACEKLYNHMLTMPGYYEILQKHNATASDLEKISSLIQLAGYEYYRNDFLPVALISFGKSLDFLLAHRNKLLESSKINHSVIDESIKRLYA